MATTDKGENTARGWSEEQWRIFDRWVEALQSVGAPKAGEGLEELRQTTLRSWEESVNNTVRAQEELSKIVEEALDAWAPRPQDSRQAEAVRQMQEAVRSWTDVQRQAWSGFFELAKRLDVNQLTDTWNEMMEAGQQSMKDAWETQARWFNSFYGPAQPSGTRGKKSTSGGAGN